ncbi:class I SAM-dependent methyltransferase [Planomicrobium okeanokoites]|uniref:class I SAM-dependent methyltransferase n=1 Tax=Planomicrobium okeanokoites TaxID=244 RepID=UPI002493915A|nr:class I SAM-dependent methyltransferase [Planomicrobium okeanokoites]
MNNTWNKIIYKIWSPVYDIFFNASYFGGARKKLFQDIKFNPNQKILFVGIGTGADLEHFDYTGLDIIAIDLSSDMLKIAKKKTIGSSILFLEMDAQKMSFEDEQFDVIVANLVLSVVPEPHACFREMFRVLKKSGEIIIFDKFNSISKKPSIPKEVCRNIIKFLGTDIDVKFEDLYEEFRTELFIKEETPILFGEMYKKIILSKRE